MSQKLVHESGVLPAASVVLYRVPEGVQALIVDLRFVNTDAGAARTVTCVLRSRRDSATRAFMPLSTVASLALASLSRPFGLQSGDSIEAMCGTANVVDWNLSVLETPNP